MARGDIPYARFECNLFMHKIVGNLPPDDFSAWVKMNLYAIHERRDSFNLSEYSWQQLGKCCGYSAGKTEKLFKRLAKVGLFGLDDNGVTVYGVRLKNKGFIWKDSPSGEQAGTACPYGSGSGIGNDITTKVVGTDGEATGPNAWVAVACDLTGHKLPTDTQWRADCLTWAGVCFERYGDKANDVLSPVVTRLKQGSGVVYPSKVLQKAAEGEGGTRGLIDFDSIPETEE